MKKFIILLLIAVAFISVSAQTKTAWVHLNNGNIVQGTIEKTATTITITTADGSQLHYPLVEVNKITHTEPRTPNVGSTTSLNDYATFDNGFWMGVNFMGAYSLFLTEHCSPWTELSVVGGYRFNQYLKVGIGFGARYYIENSKLRSRNNKWSFPIFATIRGNIISDEYRTVVPYYSVEVGGAIRDGLMWRPTFGIRIGQSRSAFLVGINYTGQELPYKTNKKRYVSSIGLSLGYEF